MPATKTRALQSAALCLLGSLVFSINASAAAETKTTAAGHKNANTGTSALHTENGTRSAGSAGSSSSAIDLNNPTVTMNTKGYAKAIEREILKPEPSLPIDEIIKLNGQPKCLRIRFDDEKVESNNDFGKKHLLIFPVKGLADLYKDAERKKVFAERLGVIKKIIATSSDRGIQDIPIFPESDAAQVFHNQERFLKFKQGAGISFISSYGNGDPPLKNDSQFYCFQGLTDDHRFYVSFFTPIKSVGMPEDLPINKGITYLEKLPRSKFTPDLDSLDHMIQSIEIK
jgi:hypothetical protein